MIVATGVLERWLLNRRHRATSSLSAIVVMGDVAGYRVTRPDRAHVPHGVLPPRDIVDEIVHKVVLAYPFDLQISDKEARASLRTPAERLAPPTEDPEFRSEHGSPTDARS